MRYGPPRTEEPRELLEKTMTDDASCRARTRAQSRFLRSQGPTIKAIATTSQVDRDTVASGLKPWAHHGAPRVQDHPRSGRPPTRTPDAQVIAQHSSKDEPRSLHSVVERFANHPEKRRRLASLQRLAQQARLRWQRGRKACKRLRAPEAFAQCQGDLAALQQQEDPGKSARSYCAAAGCALEPTLPEAGQEPKSVIALPAIK